ncbi:MAG: hypothetical protein JST78_12780 [Bacteroidetes bacterium]|nr:hypothetical protein [Bacteroidota bacterium]
MKIRHLFILIVSAVLLFSCTPESSFSTSTTSSNNTGNFSIGGVAATSPTTTAKITENLILVNLKTSDNHQLDVEFNTNGNLASATLVTADGTIYKNYKFYAANYFTFHLDSYNESSRRVKVSFSGKLYLNNENLSSEFKNISGSFEATCRNIAPLVGGLEIKCKINNNQWYQTNAWYDGSNATYRWVSDNEYLIITTVNSTSVIGEYTFSPGSSNKFELAKFDTNDLQYKVYNCTGSYSVTGNQVYNEFLGQNIVTGTYNFTAVNPANPSEQITVSDGVFKQIFTQE